MEADVGQCLGGNVAGSEGKSKGFHIGASAFAANPLAPGLYIVSTPIGNLGDITLRALETLAAADVVLCEDTRHSARLLDHYGIKVKRSALHEHNERTRIESIIGEIGRGAAIALISDAGTPLVSDPGFPLVRAARERGIAVFAVPGPSALLSALSIAGLPTDRFAFFGFLPPKAAARKKELQSLTSRQETLVFYESPRRLAAALEAMAEIFGSEREAAVALELTKKFEQVARGSLGDLAARFASADARGEAVVLVAGNERTGEPDAWRDALSAALAGQSLRAAVDEIAAAFSIPRKKVYDEALALKKTKG